MSSISKFALTLNKKFPEFPSSGKVFIPAEEYVLKNGTGGEGTDDYYAFPVIAETVINAGETVHLNYGRSESHSAGGPNNGSWFGKSLNALQTLISDVNLSPSIVPAGYGIGSIGKTATGRLIIDYQQYSGEVSGGVVKFIKWSDDDGASWSTQERLTNDYVNGIVDGPSRPIQYDGEMIKAFYVNTIATNAYFPVVYLYTNNGQTRVQLGVIYPTGWGFEEPCLEKLADNFLIGMLRNDVIDPAGVYISWSPNGKNWSVKRYGFPSVGKSPIIVSENQTCLSLGRNALKRDGTATVTPTLRKMTSIFAHSANRGRTWEWYPLDTRNGGYVYADGFWDTNLNKAVSVHSVEKGKSGSALEGADLIVRYYNEVNESDVAAAVASLTPGFSANGIANVNFGYRCGFRLPSNSKLAAWNTFIAWGLSSGVLAKLDFAKIIVFNDATCQDFACIDIKDPRKFLATRFQEVGALGYPNYSALGFKSNKINNYVSLNWDPALNGVNFTLNSACIIIDVTEAPTGGVEIGSYKTAGGTVVTQISLFNESYILNSGVPATISTPVKTGLFAVNRSASNAVQVYRNGASIGSHSQASVSIPAGEWVIGARATETVTNGNRVYDQYCDSRIGLVAAGGSLTAGEHADLYTNWLAFKTAIGL